MGDFYNPNSLDGLYESKDWKLKRRKILIRDNFECQECFNNKLIKKSVKGKILEVSIYVSPLIVLNRSNELFYKNAYTIEYLDDLGRKYSQNILSHLVVTDFDVFKGSEIFFCTIRNESNNK